MKIFPSLRASSSQSVPDICGGLARPFNLRAAISLFALVLAACSGGEKDRADKSAQALSDPPFWTGINVPPIAHPPVAWPSEPAPSACGATCGDWKPYTRFQQTLNDPRTQDPSNGGTSPQGYVNISSSCTDKALPSIYYNLHQHPSDPTQDVILFRWRVAQSGHTYATGPSAGSFGSSNPWSSALWTVLFNVDGSGYRQLAAHINGSSGSPADPVDRLAGIYGRLPTQSISYEDDPTNIKLLGSSPTAFIDSLTGKILNFNGNPTSPTAAWPLGAGEVIWDYGNTRAMLVTDRPCTEYFIDYQIPVALLDATAHGGPKVDRSTPISMLFCTANSLNNPLQKDCALNRGWTGTLGTPGPFGDFISFDQVKPYAQPIVKEVTSTAPSSCSETYVLTAKVTDSLYVNAQGTMVPSVKTVSFHYYYDTNGDGTSNDGSNWTPAVNGTLVPGKLNEWRATWDSRGLPRGSYLIGVQAVDDNTKLDDGMTATGIDNRTFSYVTSDSLGQVYINDGGGTPWKIDPLNFPTHAPAVSPVATENWYGNPLVTGIQVSGTGVDVALNACGVGPELTMSATPSSLAPLEATVFTATVNNGANTFAITVPSLTVSIPLGFTYVPGSTTGTFGIANPVITNGGTTLTWTFAPASVAALASGTLNFSATASTTAGGYNASATASTSFGAIASDPVPLTVYAASTTLTLSPSVNSVSPNGSTQVVYSITYQNSSAVTLTGATLNNPLAANVSYVGCTGGSACSFSGGAVNWTLGTLAPGAAGTATFTVTVAPAFTATYLANTVTLAAAAPQGVAISKTASSTIAVVQPVPAYSLNVATSADRIAPGGAVTYTISYGSQGTGPATGTLLVNQLPAGFAFTSCAFAGSHFTACTNASGTVTFSGAAGAGISLASGASGTVTVVATASSVTPFTYPNPAVNTVTLSGSGVPNKQETVDVGVTGDYCNLVYYFHRGTDNVLSTVRPASPSAPTSAVVYSTAVPSITSGSFLATNVHTDQIKFVQETALSSPVVLTNKSLTIDFYLGATQGGASTRVVLENATTNAAIATSADISVTNGTNLYTYTVNITSPTTLGANEKLRWVFQFQKPGGATRDITFYYDSTVYPSHSSFCSPTSPAVLSVRNSVNKSVIAGPVEKLTYTLRYSNTGGSAATSVVVSDALPAGMTNCEYSLNGTTWLACSSLGTNPQSHTFATVASLAAGASGTVYVRGDSPASPVAGAALTNTVSVSASGLTTVTDTASTSVTSAGSGGTPRIVVGLVASKSSMGPAERVTYTLTVSNVGTAPASNVVISDTAPGTAWFHYVPGSITGATPGTPVGNNLSWTIPTLTTTTPVTLSFQMESDATGIPSGANAVTNSASASDAAYCTGTLPSSCTSNVVTTYVNGSAALTLGSTSSPIAPATVSPGDEIAYTLTAGSTGSSIATGVVLTDVLPAHTRFVAITLGSGSYNAVRNRVEFSLGTLASGASAVRAFRVVVDDTLPPGTTPVLNVATLSANNAALQTSSLSLNAVGTLSLSVESAGAASLPSPAARLAALAVNTTTVTVNRADLLELNGYIFVGGGVARVLSVSGSSVTLDTPVTAAAGEALYRSAVYSVSVQNAGNVTAQEVVLTSVLPTGWRYVSAGPAATSAPSVGANGGTVTWSLGSLSADAIAAVQIVAVPTVSGSLSSSVEDTVACTGGPTPGCSDAVATIVGGLTVRKRTTTPVVNVASADGTASYAISIENSLGAPVTGVSVTDLLPAGFVYASGTASIPPDVMDDGLVGWTGLVVPDTGLEILFSATVPQAVGSGVYDNNVTVVGPGGVGVTPFDALATTDEDVSVAGAGTLVTAGYVYRDRPALNVLDASDTGLEGISLAIDDGTLNPYTVETDGFGYFRRLVPSGTWTVAVPGTAANVSALTGLVLGGGYMHPMPVSDASPAAASSVRFGYVAAAGAEHTVTVSVGANGQATPLTIQVPHGDTTSILFTPDAGYEVDTASGCGAGTLDNNTYTTAAITGDCQVTVSFTPAVYTVTLDVVGGGGAGLPVTQQVAHGLTAAIDLTALPNYSLQSVSGCGGVADQDPFITAALTGDCTVTAVFAIDQFNVSVTSGVGGTLTPTPQTIDYNTTASFTVNPDPGYHLDSVTGVCADSWTNNTYTTAPVTQDCVLSATFALDQFTVTPLPATGGSLVPATAQTVSYLGTVSFTPVAATGYHVVDVTGCGGTFDGTTFVSGAITADCDVTPTFALDVYSVTTSIVGGGGSLGPTPQFVSHGLAASFTLAILPGYDLVSITPAGCTGSLSGMTYTTGFLSSDCVLTATFALREYQVTTVVNGLGNLTPTTQTISHGASAVFTVSPGPGYHVTDVTGCGVGVRDATTYTTAPVTGDCVVTATFDINQYNVEATSTGFGGITPTPQVINHGATAVFTLAPDPGYHVQTVTGCGVGVLSGNTYTTAAIVADCDVEATFEINQYTVSEVVVAGGHLTPSSRLVSHGSTASFTPVPDPGYSVQTVTGCYGGTFNGTTFTTGPVVGDCVITPVFALSQYTVTLNVIGGGGSGLPATQQVTYNTTASIDLIPLPHYSLDSVSGCGGVADQDPFVTGAITGDCTVTAVFVVDEFSVSVTSVGGGTLTPTPQSVAYNTAATFTVNPNPGHHLVSVTGDCAGSLSSTTYTTGLVTDNCALTATFAINQYTVTPLTAVGGGLTPATAQTVNYLGTTTFTPVPWAGYHVVDVTGCGGSFNGTTFTTGPLTADCEVTPTFAINVYTLTTTIVGGGGTLGPTPQFVTHGLVASVTLVVFPGYELLDITGVGCTGALVDEDTYTTDFLSSDCELTATFALKEYEVSTVINGLGTLTPSPQTVAHGSTAVFTVTPATGYHVASVTGCGPGILDPVSYTTAPITADCVVTATFDINQYTVSEAVVVGGHLTPSSRLVDHGSTVTFVPVADVGYTVQTVTGCFSGTFDGTTFTTGPVTGDCVVTPVFTLNQYTVSSPPVTGGHFTVSSQLVSHGDTVTLVPVADVGYSVQSVTGCFSGTFNGTTYTTGAITGNCTVTAVFELNQYTVSTSVVGRGSFSPSGPQTVDYDDTAVFTVTPSTGYVIDSVTGCSGSLAGSTYTTGPIHGDCTVTATFVRPEFSLRLTAGTSPLPACGQSTLTLQLVDSADNPVVPSPLDPVMVTLTATALTGTPQIIQTGLESPVLVGGNEVTGKLPDSGTATFVVSLDAAAVLQVGWSSPQLGGSPGSLPVTFQVGAADADRSTVLGNGTALFAGTGFVDVTVVPIDACGLNLGPGHTVQVATTFGTLTPVVDNGDGTYTARFSSPPGVCPPLAAQISATVNGIVLTQRAPVTVTCAALNLDSVVSADTTTLRACASKGEFARVKVIPRDANGVGLAAGQAVTLVENPPFVVSGGVEVGVDPGSGDPMYTVLVGSHRCSKSGPRPVEILVGGVALNIRPALDFTCPPIEPGGVTFTATPSEVPADGKSETEILIAVVDACGNPGFGLPVNFQALGGLPVVLSGDSATTANLFNEPDDGKVRVRVRSGAKGTAGLGVQINGRWHDSAGDLMTFLDPDYYFGGQGCGTSGPVSSSGVGWLWGLAWLAVLLHRKARR